jgi:hypothetical protein
MKDMQLIGVLLFLADLFLVYFTPAFVTPVTVLFLYCFTHTLLSVLLVYNHTLQTPLLKFFYLETLSDKAKDDYSAKRTNLWQNKY